MKLAYITACCYPSIDRIHMLQESARYCTIPLMAYGVGQDRYQGWGWIKCDMLMLALQQHAANGFTHVLYTDGIDSLFIAPSVEIEAKYQRLGAPPMLMSTEKQCYPHAPLAAGFTHESPFRYPNAGQFIGEIQWILRHLRDLKQRYGREDNDQAWWIAGYVDGRVPDMQLDCCCQIFQNMNAHIGREVEIINGRVRNNVTGTKPCVLHFSGGYCDPKTGRDSIMQPFWEDLTR